MNTGVHVQLHVGKRMESSINNVLLCISSSKYQIRERRLHHILYYITLFALCAILISWNYQPIFLNRFLSIVEINLSKSINIIAWHTRNDKGLNSLSFLFFLSFCQYYFAFFPFFLMISSSDIPSVTNSYESYSHQFHFTSDVL